MQCSASLKTSVAPGAHVPGSAAAHLSKPWLPHGAPPTWQPDSLPGFAFADIGIHAMSAAPATTPLGSLTEPLEAPLRQEDAGVDAGTRADAGSATPSFPTYAQITADSGVTTAMDTAWSDTKSATTATSRREQGFWIKYDTASSGYTCAPTFVGASVASDATGAADPGTKPADSGTTYTVGLFHTHTPMTHRTGGSRGVGPSGADDRFHNSNGVVGVIYDYVESPAGSGTIPAGHPLNSAATRYHSGPNRRT